MQPFSYTALKVVQDQKVAEALEQHRFAVKQERRSLKQMFDGIIARFTRVPSENFIEKAPDCGKTVAETVC